MLGRYTLLERLGEGATAEVFRARAAGPEGFEKIVVIKRLHADVSRRGEDPQRYLRMLVDEARVTASLHHPNIVQTYELGEADGGYYIVMEYVDGVDLWSLLGACARERRRIPIELVLYMIGDVCKGLAYAHAATSPAGEPLGIVHRDVTPANVLLSRHGDVKLADFGVARTGVAARSPTDPRANLRGKLAYLSPEQVTGGAVDHRSDLFSLGIVLYEALTLRRLFAAKLAGQTLARIKAADIEPRLRKHPDLPEPIRAVLRRTLARSPDDRYESAEVLHEALLDFLFEQRLRVSRRKLRQFVAEATGDAAPATCPPTVRRAPTPPPPRDEAKLGASVFKLRAEDGSVFGPVTYDNLCHLVRSHAVAPAERVSVDGGPWVSASQVTGIRRMEPVLFDEADGPARLEGRFDRHDIPRLLLRLATEAARGKLALRHGSVLKQVWLQAGAPVHVSSNLKEELLGPYVVAKAGVSEADLIRASALVRGTDGFLGEALVSLGVLPPHQLFRLLQDQLRDKLLQLFAWREGRFAFYDGEDPPDGMPQMRHNLIGLVTAGVRQHMSPRDLWAWYSERLGHSIHLARLPPISHHALQLNARESRFAAALRNGAGLRQLAERLGGAPDDRATLLRVVYLFERAGLVRLTRPPRR